MVKIYKSLNYFDMANILYDNEGFFNIILMAND